MKVRSSLLACATALAVAFSGTPVSFAQDSTTTAVVTSDSPQGAPSDTAVTGNSKAADQTTSENNATANTQDTTETQQEQGLSPWAIAGIATGVAVTIAAIGGAVHWAMHNGLIPNPFQPQHRLHPRHHLLRQLHLPHRRHSRRQRHEWSPRLLLHSLHLRRTTAIVVRSGVHLVALFVATKLVSTAGLIAMVMA